MPRLLVSWTRLLAGGLRDPLVGRDVLAGCAVGCALATVACVRVLLPGWLGRPAEPLMLGGGTLGTADVLVGLAAHAGVGMFLGLAVLFLYFLARRMLRRTGPAMIAVVLVLAALPTVAAVNPLLVLPLSLLNNGLAVLTLGRIGLLALMVAGAVVSVIGEAPAIVPLGAWHTGFGVTMLGAIAALAAYGFHTSLGGRPAFGALGDD
jgi:hypothetical protein